MDCLYRNVEKDGTSSKRNVLNLFTLLGVSFDRRLHSNLKSVEFNQVSICVTSAGGMVGY